MYLVPKCICLETAFHPFDATHGVLKFFDRSRCYRKDKKTTVMKNGFELGIDMDYHFFIDEMK